MKCRGSSETCFAKVRRLYGPFSRGKRPFKVCRRWRRSDFHCLQLWAVDLIIVGGTAYTNLRSGIYMKLDINIHSVFFSCKNSRLRSPDHFLIVSVRFWIVSDCFPTFFEPFSVVWDRFQTIFGSFWDCFRLFSDRVRTILDCF